MTAAADRVAGAVSRTAAVLVLLLSLRAEAEGMGGFDQALAAQVFTAGLTFMLPRTLDAVPAPQMAIWGLRGITALDPSLVPVLHDADVTLIASGAPLAVMKLPAPDDLAGWGVLAASLSAVAHDHSEALRRAGTEGMIGSFFDEVFNHLDPYSRYVPPRDAAAERDRRLGSAGIGLSLEGRPGALLVAGVTAGGPAAAAGIRPGDQVIAIDRAPLRRVDAAAAASLLAGAEGEPVTVAVRVRGGRILSARVVRALVPANTVRASRDGGVLVVRIDGFTGSTAARISDEITRGLARNPQPAGLVLDMRGNRGGLLREAVAAANLLLTTGPIATTSGRNPAAIHVWQAAGVDLADGLPVVVVVDGRSASAAEVLAAALGDDGRAVVVGSTTLGKGLVQTVTSLPDRGELFVTWSRILAPRGWPLQGLGVMPEVCTSLGQDATQTQLAALNAGTQPMQAVLRTQRAARPNLPLAEMLTIRNACPAALGGDTDMDAAKFLIANPIAYATALAPRG